VFVLLWSCDVGKSKKNENNKETLYQDTISVETPFEILEILIPNFERFTSFPITDFGDEEKNTQQSLASLTFISILSQVY